mgnify:CR=1 FL=1
MAPFFRRHGPEAFDMAAQGIIGNAMAFDFLCIVDGQLQVHGRQRRQRPADADEQAVEEALKLTGTQEFAHLPVEKLSGGQRQRCWIAMVLAQQAGILLLDEPINHLDLNHQVEIMDLLVDLRQQGKTLIVVLHDLNLASRYADHLVLMKQGAIVAQGAASEVLTAVKIEHAYQQPVSVVDDPVYGGPMVIPLGRHRNSTSGLRVV